MDDRELLAALGEIADDMEAARHVWRASRIHDARDRIEALNRELAEWAEAFVALHEEAVDLIAEARSKALEEAAKVADAECARNETERLRRSKPGRDPNDERSNYLWSEQTARGIATAIRNLIDNKVGTLG